MLETLKQCIHGRFAHAHALILDLGDKHITLLAGYGEPHRSLFCELDGVGQQVLQDLPKPESVQLHKTGNIAGSGEDELQPLFLAPRTKYSLNFVEQGTMVKGCGHDIQLACLQFAVVE